MPLHNTIDISDELIISNHLNGIRLVRPNGSDHRSIKNLFKLSANVFFLRPNSSIEKLNETCIKSMAFDSEKEAYGKTMLDISPLENAQTALATDLEVVKTSRRHIVKNTIILNKDDIADQTFLSVKMPWYNEANHLVGVFGASILFDHPLFAETLDYFSHLGWLNNNPPNFNPILSKRENGLIPYTKQGKTAKEIALSLHLSVRTIEYYIANIKDKLQVSKKSKLIDKTLELES